MTPFIDPRTDPDPKAPKPHPRITTDRDDLIELHRSCREGRLYDVERWIKAGKPLQKAEDTPPARRRGPVSALEIALNNENHSLTLLLLANGYDPNVEHHCPLDQALRSRRWDLLDMLLDWGADPLQADPYAVLDTYQSDLFERFRDLGVDLTDGNALPDTLAHHTSNKPLFGLAKRHQEDPAIQTELNMALVHHVEEGSEKGVMLSLWAGADPHAPTPSLRWGSFSDPDDEEEHFVGFSAIHEACRAGDVEILKRLGPDPSLDDFEDLYCTARNEWVITFLARLAPPKDIGKIICTHMSWYNWDTYANPADTLRCLFRLPARWEKSDKEEVASVRHYLLKTSDYSFVDLMKLLAEGDNVAPDILRDLGRTQAMRRRMKEVGFVPPSPGDPTKMHRGYENTRPTRSREVLAKFGVETKKKAKERRERPLSTIEWIGHRRPGSQEVRLTREEFYERVWSKPIMHLAKEWSLSDRGLGKACRRLKMPVPPRGYWASVKAGQRPKRQRLPTLKPGECEEIVVWEEA